MPLQSELGRIVGLSGTTLLLEHPTSLGVNGSGVGELGVSATGAWIANVDFRVSGGKGGGDMMGTRHVCRDVTLVNHRLRQSGQSDTSNATPMAARSGMYNAHVEAITVDGMVANLVFGNGFVRSTWKNIRGNYIRRAIEVKFQSHDTRFEDIVASKMNHGYDPEMEEDNPITIGENAHRIEVIRPRVDVGQWNAAQNGEGKNLIGFSGATDCAIVDPVIAGAAGFGSAIAFTETAVRCLVRGGRILPPSTVVIENYGANCEVIGTTFGTASLYAYRHNAIAQGGRMNSCQWQGEAPVKFLPGTLEKDQAFEMVGNIGISGIDNTARRALGAGFITSR